MTRINLIPVEELTRKHLVAEYRELPRVFGMMRRWQEKEKYLSAASGMIKQAIPGQFTLGTGHMTFFVDKGKWLLRRQKALIDEMVRRGYAPQFTDPTYLARDLDPCFMGDWESTSRDVELSRSRIEQRKAEGRGMWWVGHMGEWQSRDPAGYSITERDGRTYLHDPSGELLGTFGGRHSAQHEAERHSKLPPPIRPIEIPRASDEYTMVDKLREQIANGECP